MGPKCVVARALCLRQFTNCPGFEKTEWEPDTNADGKLYCKHATDISGVCNNDKMVVAALTAALGELGGKMTLLRLNDKEVGLWLTEPQRCCNGAECGCMGLPVDPPDKVFVLYCNPKECVTVE